MIYLFNDYGNDDLAKQFKSELIADVNAMQEVGRLTKNFRKFDENDYDLIWKILDRYVHRLKWRTIFSKTTDKGVSVEMINSIMHNGTDLLVAYLSIYGVDVDNYGSEKTMLSAIPYRADESEETVWAHETDTYSRAQNLQIAINLMNSKNRVLDKIYKELEQICRPFISGGG